MSEAVEFNELLLDNLFQALDARDESLRQLSIKIGANERYLAELRSKRSKIKAESLAWICAKLDLDPSQIMGFGDRLVLKPVLPAHIRAHSGASGRSFQQHPVSRSGLSGHPLVTPLSMIS